MKWLGLLVATFLTGYASADDPTDCDQRSNNAGRVACYTERSSPLYPANQIPIPPQCRDPDGVFHPVRYLYSRESYQIDSYLFQPVEGKNGILTYDFNLDGQPDYVFVERELDERIYLTLCMSSRKDYQRAMTDIGLEEYKEPSLAVTSHNIAEENGLLRIRRATHAHNDGTDAITHWYRWDANRKDFALNKTRHETYRGDGQIGDIRDEYDLQTLTYRQVQDCSRVSEIFAEGCQPYDKTGSFTLNGAAPLLLRPTSVSGKSERGDFTLSNW